MINSLVWINFNQVLGRVTATKAQSNNGKVPRITGLEVGRGWGL